MVTNKEISERLKAKREGKSPKKEISQENIGQTKRCPQCDMENKEDAKFCVGCGKSFNEIPVASPKPKINTKTCPSCKSEIPENAKFCVVCGQTQQDTSETVMDEEVKDEEIDETPLKLILQELVLDERGLSLNKMFEVNGLENELIDYNTMENITIKGDGELKTIEITTSNKEIQIKEVNPDFANLFVSKAQEMVEKTKPDAEAMDKIQKAKELLDIGAIDKEEFENIKRKILKKE